MPIAAFIAEYGVIAWAARSGVWLYKHNTAP
jgi:hypothetical protein